MEALRTICVDCGLEMKSFHEPEGPVRCVTCGAIEFIPGYAENVLANGGFGPGELERGLDEIARRRVERWKTEGQ